MKTVCIWAALFSLTAFAHDGGHGPTLSDTGKYGGLMTAVVLKSDAAKEQDATLVYKAELSRAEGVVRVYLYDKDMKPLDLKNFDKKAQANVGSKVKGKWTEQPFTLELKGNAFQGPMPKPQGKPYAIDVTLKGNGKELLSAFENLD